jgi:GAF domain-containing protein
VEEAQSFLAAEFAELAANLHDEPTVEHTVEKVLDFALNATGADECGVILVHRKKTIETVAATDPVVAKLDALQMAIGDGPDLAILSEQPIVVVRDTHADQRWPTWAGLVAEAGIRSLLGVRLNTPGITVGSLNLYARAPEAFDADDRAVAQILARHAAVALSSALNAQNMWEAVDARKRIGQAQGILMERFDLSADQAFAVLLRYSQDNNLKLRAVAETLIETRELPN